IESRLQDFFGMKTGPVIAGGRARVVFYFFASDPRPGQGAPAPAGFWHRVSPQVRREVRRPYPPPARPPHTLASLTWLRRKMGDRKISSEKGTQEKEHILTARVENADGRRQINKFFMGLRFAFGFWYDLAVIDPRVPRSYGASENQYQTSCPGSVVA